MASPEKEVIFEINRMIVEDTTNLWTIAIGLTAVEIAIICHLVRAKRLPYKEIPVAIAMSLAAAVNLISISFGFLAKNGLIGLMLETAAGKPWAFEPTIEVMNALQMVFMLLGVAIFLLIFYFYSKVLAGIMVSVMGKDGKDG
jgi:hypothetical protein